MIQRRFQIRVVESAFTLPVCAALAVIMWWWPEGSFSINYLMGLLLCVLTAYVLLELNNANILIRKRTRMVSALWFALAGGTGFLHTATAPLFATCCMAISYSQLCRTYQRTGIAKESFHAHLFLSLGSLAFPPLLLLSLPYGFYLFVFMRGLSTRTFWGALIGFFLPYWLWTGWCLWQQDFGPMLTHLAGVADFRIPGAADYLSLTLPVLAAWGLTTLLALVGVIHYMHNFHEDKIRVRMFLYVLVCQTVLLGLTIPLQPHFVPFLLPILLAGACPLIAHYFALTDTWRSNAFFILSILLYAAVAVTNLWMPS